LQSNKNERTIQKPCKYCSQLIEFSSELATWITCSTGEVHRDKNAANTVDLIKSQTTDISHQIVSLAKDLAIVKRNLWEANQEVRNQTQKIDKILDVINRQHGFGISSDVMMGDHE